MRNRKKTIMQGIVCVGLLLMIWSGYFLVKYFGTDRILDIEKDDFSWVYQVDTAETKNGDFILQGFAFELDVDAVEGKFEIVLQDIESGKRYFPKMEYMDRTDVNEYFLCEYDYLQSGFVAIIKEKKLALYEKNYEILLRSVDERRAYQTGTFISKGKLMYANPQEYEPLDVEGTDLEKIVKDGILRVYRPDCGMYVYQYDGKLYWIAEPEYGFVDGDTYIQYQLDTTQVSRLPQQRIENKVFWDNIGFKFNANELRDANWGKYRVARRDIPTEYSVEKIWTGNHINKWIWKQDFRPYYEFRK